MSNLRSSSSSSSPLLAYSSARTEVTIFLLFFAVGPWGLLMQRQKKKGRLNFEHLVRRSSEHTAHLFCRVPSLYHRGI